MPSDHYIIPRIIPWAAPHTSSRSCSTNHKEKGSTARCHLPQITKTLRRTGIFRISECTERKLISIFHWRDSSVSHPEVADMIRPIWFVLLGFSLLSFFSACSIRRESRIWFVCLVFGEEESSFTQSPSNFTHTTDCASSTEMDFRNTVF